MQQFDNKRDGPPIQKPSNSSDVTPSEPLNALETPAAEGEVLDDDFGNEHDGIDDEEWHRQQVEYFAERAERQYDPPEERDDGIKNTSFARFKEERSATIADLVLNKGYSLEQVCRAYEGDCPEHWIDLIVSEIQEQQAKKDVVGT